MTIGTYRPVWRGGHYKPLDYLVPWFSWANPSRATLWIGWAWTGQVAISWRRK